MRMMGNGVIFLLAGAGVYAYNTESHDSKIVLGRFGLPFGETETVAILLGIGVLLMLVGGVQWLRRRGDAPAADDLER